MTNDELSTQQSIFVRTIGKKSLRHDERWIVQRRYLGLRGKKKGKPLVFFHT